MILADISAAIDDLWLLGVLAIFVGMGVNAVRDRHERRRDAGFGQRYTERMTKLALDRRAAIRDAELAEMRRQDGRLPPLGPIDQ